MGLTLATAESSLLLTLEEVSQLVSHSHHAGETLANIVTLIQARFCTDVCSVYLYEPESNDLLMRATVGLKPESVGHVRMRIDEGLTGLVAEQMRPVMVEDASSHPRFKFFPQAGEEPYHSFLGIPLVEGGMLQGVLVVQTVEARKFSPNEVRLLVAVGSQLAPLVSEARMLEVVSAVAMDPQAFAAPQSQSATLNFTGTGLSAGVGWGHAYVVNGFQEWQNVAREAPVDAVQEEQRLSRAMTAAREEISRLSQRISALVGEDHGAILQVQLMIRQDDHIKNSIHDGLRAGRSAEAAILDTLEKYVEAFQKLSNPVFQERVYDIKDVCRRILWHLRPGTNETPGAEDRLIILAHDASVMDLFMVDLERLAGIVVERGGAQSHAVILARSLGIPMVGQIGDLLHHVAPGRPLRVDGGSGQVELDASPESVPAEVKATGRSAPACEFLPLDPDLPQIEANINLLCEVGPALAAGTTGVGLYRSEFLFLARRTLPTEDEQVGIYAKLLQLLQGRAASIRTFDLRPDKLANYSQLPSSAAHPLDWRLVLTSPPLQKLFKDQVRAILRAAVAGPARIMVPLVTSTEQFDFILETIGQAKDDLQREGHEFNPRVPFGVMLEVAAATALVATWAEHVDSFALGTNDLIASVLGIDRERPVGATKHDALHPGVLRIVSQVVETAHAAGRRVCVCGEMASDPEGALALAALQVDSLSLAVQQLPSIRQLLSRQCGRDVMALKSEILRQRTALRVREFLQSLNASTQLEPAGVI
ncbi:phosphoenolpyruvate--protein phosphotransferase [soil metagenome]